MARERFLVFFFLISFVLFGCSIISNDSDDEVVTTQPTTTTKTISGKVEFPASAGTTASIRAKVDFTKYRVYINDVLVTLNDDGTFSGDVPEADEYDIQVRFAGSKKAVLQAYATKDDEDGEIEVDVKTTAKSLAFKAYKKQAGKSEKKFEEFKKLIDEVQDVIDDLAETIENALKSLTNLESENFDLEEDEEIKKKTEETTQKVEEEEAKQATTSTTTTSSSTSSTTTATVSLPSGVLAINDGAAKTDSTSVILNLSGVTGTGVITMSVDGGDFETLNQAKPYSLSSGDGEKTVTIILKDSNGQSEPIGDTIILDTSVESTPEPPKPMIDAGGGHVLLLKVDRTVWAWGNNSYYQLGVGTEIDEQENPVQVGVEPTSSTSSTSTTTTTSLSPLTDCMAVSAGGLHSLALKSDGTVVAWGSNDYGQLGIGDEEESSDEEFPVPIPNFNNVIGISAGYEHSLAVKSDGTAWAWGTNDSGRLGIGDENGDDEFSPVQIGENLTTTSTSSTSTSTANPLTGVIAVAAGGYHSLALKSDGSVWGWGYNGDGQCGIGDEDTDDQYRPVRVGSVTGTTTSSTSSTTGATFNNIIAIAAGYDHCIALKSDGAVFTWGYNDSAQCGLGEEADEAIYWPTQVPGLTGIVAIAAGYNTCYVLKSDGTVWGWGYNNSGELGDGIDTGEYYYEPFQIKKNTTVSASIRALVVTSTTTSTSSAQPLTGIVDMDGGYTHSAFVKQDDSHSILGEFTTED
ncbi:hypothetical protein ACFL35_02115 [Candidatus Riflebacteria bacterium]